MTSEEGRARHIEYRGKSDWELEVWTWCEIARYRRLLRERASTVVQTPRLDPAPGGGALTCRFGPWFNSGGLNRHHYTPGSIPGKREDREEGDWELEVCTWCEIARYRRLLRERASTVVQTLRVDPAPGALI